MAPEMFSIRQAVSRDLNAICACDPIVRQDDRRRAFIQRSVEAGACFVVTAPPQVVGYAVLEYSFYGQGFISMLCIHPRYRRQGAATLLLRYVESICQTEKVFTSTNLSNGPMQSLLTKLGYLSSGIIYHLDEEDPELVYVKYLKRTASRRRAGPTRPSCGPRA